MDDSKMAAKALAFALDAYPDTEITVLHVAGVPTPFMADIVGLALEEDLSDAAEARAQPVFDRARELAAEADREITTTVTVGLPTREIVDRAADYDVVVIGSHSRKLGARLLLGNIAESVTRRSPVPVTVVR